MYTLNTRQLQIQQIGANIHSLSNGLKNIDETYVNLNYPSQVSLYNSTGGGVSLNYDNYNLLTGIYTNNVKYNLGYYADGQQYYFDGQDTKTQMLKNENNIVYLKTSTFSEVVSDLQDFLRDHATDRYGTIRFTLDESQTVKVGKFKNNDVEFEDSTIPINSFGIDDSLVIVDDYTFYIDNNNVSVSNPRIINSGLVRYPIKAAAGFGPFDISSIIVYSNGSPKEYTDVYNTYNSAPTGLFINPFLKIIYSTRHFIYANRSLNNIYAYNLSKDWQTYSPQVQLLSGIMDYAMAETFDVGCMFLQINVVMDADTDNPVNIPINIRCFDRQKLLRYISYYGMQGTYDRQEALTTPSEDLPYAPVNPEDPVSPGSKAEGYPENEKIEINTPKSLPSAGTGSIYLLNPTHLEAIRNGLWNETIFQQFFGSQLNPFDFVTGLWWYPLSTYDLFNATSTQSSRIAYRRVRVGTSNIINDDVPGVTDDASINMLDGGSLRIPIMTDSYLDFEPYTSYSLYIPYIGFQSLNSQDIVGKTLTLKYFVNIYDGTMTAYLMADNQLIGQYEGVLGQKVPITNYDSRTQALSYYIQGQENLSRASQVIAGGINTANNFGIFGPLGNIANAGTAITTQAINDIATNTTQAANQSLHNMYNNYSRPYALSGVYGPQKAYIRIETSKAAVPSLKYAEQGRNSAVSGSINSLNVSGFASVSSCEIIVGEGENYITEAEKREIENVMRGGVIING